MKPDVKKLLLLNAPYLIFVWLFSKLGAAYRLTPGFDLSEKFLNLSLTGFHRHLIPCCQVCTRRIYSLGY